MLETVLFLLCRFSVVFSFFLCLPPSSLSSESTFHHHPSITNAAFLIYHWVGRTMNIPFSFWSLRILMTALLAASTLATNGFPIQIKQLSSPPFYVHGLSLDVCVNYSEETELVSGVGWTWCWENSYSSRVAENSTFSGHETGWHCTPMIKAIVPCGPAAICAFEL